MPGNWLLVMASRSTLSRTCFPAPGFPTPDSRVCGSRSQWRGALMKLAALRNRAQQAAMRQHRILVCLSAASRVDGCDRAMALAQRRSVSNSIRHTTGSDGSGAPPSAPRRRERSARVLEGGRPEQGPPA